jgi:inosose dehydratase
MTEPESRAPQALRATAAARASGASLFDSGRVYVGIEPTGWTNDDLPTLGGDTPFAQCVSEIALAGYRGCGIGHKAPTDLAELKLELERRNLRICDLWCGTYFTAPDARESTLERVGAAAALLREAGAGPVVAAELNHAVHQAPVSPTANKPSFDDRQWEALAAGLQDAARVAAAEGVGLVYHPHVGTGVQNRDEIDRLMAATDPELVGLLLDTGHLAYAGEDPLAVAEAHGARIRHLHLKDVRAAVVAESVASGRSFFDAILAGVFAVPGDGNIDFGSIFELLAGHDFGGWLVVEAEQDPARANPLEHALRARGYVHELTGV